MIKVIFSFIVGIILILVALFALDHWIIFNKKENIDKLLGIRVSNFFNVTAAKKNDNLIGEINRMYYGKISNTKDLKEFLNSYPEVSGSSFDGGYDTTSKSLIKFSCVTDKKVILRKNIVFHPPNSIRKIFIMVLVYENNSASFLLESE